MTATVLRREDHVPELLGSAGRARPGIEIRIVGPDDSPLPAEEVGELVVRGPSVMTGYWRRPEATAETIVDGWLHTGDLGRMSADGVVHLLDRAKDMIISGGSNVYAIEVEEVLATHDSWPMWRSWGSPMICGASWSSPPSCPPAATPSNTDALDTLARSQLAGYKVPRRYVALPALPRNAYGKVVKRELRELLSQDSG